MEEKRPITIEDILADSLPESEELSKCYLPYGHTGDNKTFVAYYKQGPENKELLPCKIWVTDSGIHTFDDAEEYYTYSGRVDDNFQPHGPGVMNRIKDGQERIISGYFYHGVIGFTNIIINENGCSTYLDIIVNR